MNDITIGDICREIDFRNVKMKKKLHQLGYSHRRAKDDYVRNDANGRFHIKYSRHGKWFLHYDFFGAFGMHISNIPMTSHLDREVERINHYLSTYGTTN